MNIFESLEHYNNPLKKTEKSIIAPESPAGSNDFSSEEMTSIDHDDVKGISCVVWEDDWNSSQTSE